MFLHLFGASTPSGEALRQLLHSGHSDYNLTPYSRSDHSFQFADLSDPSGFIPAGEPGFPGFWISFAPIWLFAPFLHSLVNKHPERLVGLRGVIACSSSSAITKRFAANRFDQELVEKLITAEDELLDICKSLGIICRILRPTLIYGRVGDYVDNNLNQLLQLMRRLPLLPLPFHTGMRQPIHARQLASVTLALVDKLTTTDSELELPLRIALGGDSQLSYAAMLHALQQSLPNSDPARRCRLVSLPTRLFQLCAVPLILHSPKAFEAVLRIGADLSGFIPCHQLLGEYPRPFPLPDLR